MTNETRAALRWYNRWAGRIQAARKRRRLQAKLNGRAATIRRLMEGQQELVETIGLLQEGNTSYYTEKLEMLERVQQAEADLAAIGEILAARYRRAQERADGE